MIDPAVTTSEPTSSSNLIVSRAKPPPDENVASALTGSAAGAEAGNASAAKADASAIACTQKRTRDQNPAAALRAIRFQVFQFIRPAYQSRFGDLRTC